MQIKTGGTISLLENPQRRPNFHLIEKLERTMRLDKLTTKFQEALADAQSLAVGHDNQHRTRPPAAGLLNQDDGGARSLLQRAGVNVNGLTTALQGALKRLPKVSGNGGDVQVGRDLVACSTWPTRKRKSAATSSSPAKWCCWALADDKSDAGKPPAKTA
jgi:ATP-dependent Clp protease ATP-binding subunit ClpB